MTNWSTFQSDVLDVIRQYEGYFDFLEQVGSLGDSSRPDSFGRITRNGKKEVWVVDAKKKASLEDDDKQRMHKYVDGIKSNPVDVGLDHAEMNDHEVRPVMVTPVTNSDAGFECVSFKNLHQFLQKELVYTDTDRAVRELGKMIERGQLSHEQARLIHESLSPYRKGINQLRTILNRMEAVYTGARVSFSSDVSRDYGIAVDAVFQHRPRSKTILIDVPYNRKSLEEVESKKEVIEDRITHKSDEVYYAALDRFKKTEKDFLHEPENLEDEIRNVANIISTETISKWFKPNIPIDKKQDENQTVLRNDNAGFRLEVRTENDFKHEVAAELPEKAASNIKETLDNSHKRFGRFKSQKFRISLKITGEGLVAHSDTEETLESFKQSARSIFVSSVSPILATTTNNIKRNHC